MAWEFAVAQSISAHSDHFPFLMAGVPTGGMGPAKPDLSGRGYGHTMFDTVDKVKLVGMREAAVLGARLALRIASAETWPVARRTREAVQRLLDNPDYREEMALFARVHALYRRAEVTG